MNEEKLKILTMLEEGKIDSFEAVRLLEAVDNSEKPKTENRQDIQVSHTIEKAMEDLSNKTSDISVKLLEKFNQIDKSLSGSEDFNFKKFNRNLQRISKELQNKIDKMVENIDKDNGELSKKLSSKNSDINKIIREGSVSDIKNFSTIINGFEDRIGKISTNIINAASDVGTRLSAFFPDESGDNIPSKKHILEYTKLLTQSEGMSLKFQALNGNISIEGIGDNEIETKVYCKSSDGSVSDCVLVIDEPDKYGFEANSALCQSVSYHIKVPILRFKHIAISSSNGKIKLSDLCCDTLICITSNGKISLSGITCDNIQCITTEGKINISDTKCQSIFVKTSNAPVLIDNLDSRITNINTSNGKVNLILSDDMLYKAEINIATTNSRIDVTLPILSDMALYIDARADNGVITSDIPGVSFDEKHKKPSGKNHVIYETPNYKDAENSIKITASTNNSSINFK